MGLEEKPQKAEVVREHDVLAEALQRVEEPLVSCAERFTVERA